MNVPEPYRESVRREASSSTSPITPPSLTPPSAQPVVPHLFRDTIKGLTIAIERHVDSDSIVIAASGSVLLNTTARTVLMPRDSSGSKEVLGAFAAGTTLSIEGRTVAANSSNGFLRLTTQPHLLRIPTSWDDVKQWGAAWGQIFALPLTGPATNTSPRTRINIECEGDRCKRVLVDDRIVWKSA